MGEGRKRTCETQLWLAAHAWCGNVGISRPEEWRLGWEAGELEVEVEALNEPTEQRGANTNLSTGTGTGQTWENLQEQHKIDGRCIVNTKEMNEYESCTNDSSSEWKSFQKHLWAMDEPYMKDFYFLNWWLGRKWPAHRECKPLQCLMLVEVKNVKINGWNVECERQGCSFTNRCRHLSTVFKQTAICYHLSSVSDRVIIMFGVSSLYLIRCIMEHHREKMMNCGGAITFIAPQRSCH